MLSFASRDKIARFWDAESGRDVSQCMLMATRAEICEAVFSPDWRVIVSLLPSLAPMMASLMRARRQVKRSSCCVVMTTMLDVRPPSVPTAIPSSPLQQDRTGPAVGRCDRAKRSQCCVVMMDEVSIGCLQLSTAAPGRDDASMDQDRQRLWDAVDGQGDCRALWAMKISVDLRRLQPRWAYSCHRCSGIRPLGCGMQPRARRSQCSGGHDARR